VQAIVQGRVEDKGQVVKGVKTLSKLPEQQPQAEWFNLEIADNPSVLQELHPLLPPSASSVKEVTLEISMKAEMDLLLLELWHFQVIAESPSKEESRSSPSSQQKDVFNLYNRLGVLLKSIISVSRVTPAYKIARREGGLAHQVTAEELLEADINRLLGDGYKTVSLGKIPLYGMSEYLQTTLHYRTRMELLTSTTAASGRRNTQLLIKSDHYAENPNNQKKVKPAFVETEVTDSDSSDFELDSFYFPKKQVPQSSQSPATTVTSTSEDSAISPPSSSSVPLETHEDAGKEDRTPTILPFCPSDHSQNSQSSETELLQLFEEFRVAPTTLPSFNTSSASGEKITTEFENFAPELELYDELVRNLE